MFRCFGYAVGVFLLLGAIEFPAWGMATCRDDIAKHCSKVPVGGGKIRACLMTNLDKLSEDCRGSLVPKRRRGYETSVKQTCAIELRRFCSDIGAEPEKQKTCLNEHQEDLSEACAASL